MGISSIQHNMLMANVGRHMNVNTTKRAKTAEKLSSGYKINRAADDAAGLSMSEKMRFMIRGLNQGTENVMDGISWVQIGDGSLEEAHSMLHRMTELAIKSSNGTYTDDDRAMMQAEFAQLQKEIDRLTDTTTFNEQHIFQEHEWPYHEIEGSTRWSPTETHTVREGDNDLVITYALHENDPLETVSIKVAAGTYTTKELVDEIDTALEEAGLLEKGLRFSYDAQGFCNLDLEGGKIIDEVSGGLSYLLYDNFGGGDLGALIGTTVYLGNDSFIEVEFGVNDHLEFDVLNAKAELVAHIGYDLAPGLWTKNRLMEVLQTELDKKLEAANVGTGGTGSTGSTGSAGGTGDAGDADDADTEKKGVVVSEHGASIKLSSPDYIITNFKGNMFEIDSNVRTGVFYDNIHHNSITMSPAVFQGGNVMYDTTKTSAYPTAYYEGDPERRVFQIEKGVNNLLVLNPNNKGEITIDLTDIDGENMNGKTIAEVASTLNSYLYNKLQTGVRVMLNTNLSNTSIPGVTLNTGYDAGYETDANGKRHTLRSLYTGLTFITDDKGPGATVGINKAKSTAYDTLFTERTVVSGYEKADYGGNATRPEENAWIEGGAVINGLKIEDGVNDEFSIQISDDPAVTIKVTAKTYNNASDLAGEIRDRLKEKGYDENTVNVHTVTNDKGDVVIRIDAVKASIKKIRLNPVNTTGTTDANYGFRDIFQGKDIIPGSEVNQQSVNPNVKVEMKGTVGNSDAADAERHEHAAHMNFDGNGGVKLDPGYTNLVVTIDGKPRTVDLSKGDLGVGLWSSKEKLEAYITEKLQPEEVDNGCTMNSNHRTPGRDITNTVTKGTPEDGKWTSNPPTYNVIGDAEMEIGDGQGASFKYKYNYGAKVTIGKKLEGPITITEDNKWFRFKLNNSSSWTEIDLSKLGTSFASANDLANALQGAVTAALGGKQPGDYGGVKVSASGDQLVLEAGLQVGDVQKNGKTDTRIVMDNAEGTFLWDLYKTGKPASVTLTGNNKGVGESGQAGTNIKTSGSPKVTLSLTEPGSATAKTIEINLKKEYPNYSQLISDLKTEAKKSGITVTESTYELTFTTDEGGKGYKLDVSLNSDAEKFLFGYREKNADGSYKNSYSMDGSTSYSNYTDQAVQTGFTLDTNERNFTINIDGTDVTKTLKAGPYNSRQAVADAINEAFSGLVRASIVNVSGGTNRLRLESVQTGSSHTVSLSYDLTKSPAMKKIFGTTLYGGATASISGDGTLTLTRVGGSNTGSLTVSSHDKDDNYQGGSFLFETRTDYSDPDHEDGYHSGMNSFLDGVDLDFNANGNVEITSANNQMTFWYTDDYQEVTSGRYIYKYATPKQININLAPKAGGYSMTELQDELQRQINAQTNGQQKMNVTVTKAGVRIETAKDDQGSKYRILTPEDSGVRNRNTGYSEDLRPVGTFYEKVMCSTNTRTVAQNASNVNGKQNGNEVYAVGRQDVKNEEVRIQKDGNDQLSLEFNIEYPPGTKWQSYTLQMVLDPGYYRDKSLAAQIQKQLNKALKENGLPEGMIEAVVGTVDTKVAGANDANALAFRLSETVKLPDTFPTLGNAKYGIEAIGGTAAFSVFYATDGDIARAYVKGGKDISQGVVIEPGKNTFSVDVDDEHYELELMPKAYTAKELIDHINELLEKDDVPLTALEDGGKLKLMHSSYGRHKINHLSGVVKNELFFSENGEWAGNQPMRLRASGVSGDWIEVEKPWMDTVSLGINTLTIEKFKNAQKAITRLKEAVTKVSNVRSYFGAMQNRLESTVRNNQNKTENTTAAESRIRDADISKEALDNSIHNILEQAGSSLMAQVMQNSNLALQLLQ